MTPVKKSYDFNFNTSNLLYTQMLNSFLNHMFFIMKDGFVTWKERMSMNKKDS